MADQPYNGWTNWETWNFNLWINHNEALYWIVNKALGDFLLEDTFEAFLKGAAKNIVGTELCLDLEAKDIKNINFVNADIFDEVLKENVFDFVWCNGVLHHTKDPYNAFKIILKTVKKDGYIIIGLYNKFGRIRTRVRNFFYKIF